jgi:hypothetical protein
VLVDEVQHAFTRGRDHRPECDVHRPARRNSHAPAQRKYRVEHRADGIGQRPAVHDCDRHADGAAPAEKARAVGFDLRLGNSSPSSTARCAAQTSGSLRERRRRVARMAPVFASYSVCTNSFENAAVRGIGGRRREHQLGIEVNSISRCRPPEFETDTRRTSASYSGDTRISSVVVIVPSRRTNSARSSVKVTRSSPARLRSAGSRRPDVAALRIAQEYVVPQSSRVGSSRQRVTARSPQRL